MVPILISIRCETEVLSVPFLFRLDWYKCTFDAQESFNILLTFVKRITKGNVGEQLMSGSPLAYFNTPFAQPFQIFNANQI